MLWHSLILLPSQTATRKLERALVDGWPPFVQRHLLWNPRLRLSRHRWHSPQPSGASSVLKLVCQVLHQTDSCNCGIYVLHFIRVFLPDPAGFTNFFLVTHHWFLFQFNVMLTFISSQQPQEDGDLDKIWKKDQFLSLRQDFLSYIKTTELAAER